MGIELGLAGCVRERTFLYMVLHKRYHNHSIAFTHETGAEWSAPLWRFSSDFFPRLCTTACTNVTTGTSTYPSDPATPTRTNATDKNPTELSELCGCARTAIETIK
jgi:hypothetical protein